MTKKRQSSLIIKAIMLLLALIIMIFVASLAWFAPPDRPVTAEGLSVNTTAGKEFEVAIGFKTSATGYQYIMSPFSKEIRLEDVVTDDGTHYNVLSDFTPIDVTGDGVTLVRPSMKAKNADIDRQSHTYTAVTPNKEYISFDLYFQSEQECSVYLDKGSFVKGAIEETPGDGSLVDATKIVDNRKSDDGAYSKDAIVGAVRVSFVNYKSYLEDEDLNNRNANASLLWLPRPDIFLNAKQPSSEKDNVKPWILSTGVQPGDKLTYYPPASDRMMWLQCDTYTHHYYTYKYDEYMQQIVGEDRNYPSTVTSPDKVFICDVNTAKNGKYYGKTQVNIWIEGCDAEARRTMSGGQFQVNFDLAGA